MGKVFDVCYPELPEISGRSLARHGEGFGYSTNGLVSMTNVLDRKGENDALHHAPPGTTGKVANGPFWDELGGTTLKLAALFWSSVLLIDSFLESAAGVDPVGSIPGRLAINCIGALLTIGMTSILFRFRRSGLLIKTILAFAMAAFAAPLYTLFDYQVYAWSIHPETPRFDLLNFIYTLISITAVFFGWSCLYVSLVYSFEVRDRERKLAAAREEALSAQMRALRYQINPHFLFNTLNSIAGLIEEGAATRAERMVLSLSTFLRTTLELDPLNDVPLFDELELQEDYLEIERERFPDRMDFMIDADDDARMALVPNLILQPLVENAIKHGVGRSSAPVGVRIIARRKANRLLLAVENGLGLDRKPASGFGIGLRNVAERLAARFGADARFTAGPSDKHTYRAEIELPWRVA